MPGKDAQKCQVPHTADGDELAGVRSRTAVNHKPGQVSPLHWIENQPESSVWHPTKNDIILEFSSRSFHQAITALDLRGRHVTEGNSTKSTNHQQGIMEHPI